MKMTYKLAALMIVVLLVFTATIATGAYVTKVYMTSGGDEQVVANGGQVTVQSGGEVEVESGGILDVESGGSFRIAGTAVTPSAAEINFLDGLTAGVSTASKFALLGATKNLDSLTLAYAKVTSLLIGSTAVTATATEINKLASVTAGVSSASKALVLGATKNTDSLLTDYLRTTALVLGSTAVTATGTEINKVAGVTGGTVAASKALVVGATKDLDSLKVNNPTLGSYLAKLYRYHGVPASTRLAIYLPGMDTNDPAVCTINTADDSSDVLSAVPVVDSLIVTFDIVDTDTLDVGVFYGMD